jgi:exosortase A-associated hydrolase 1
VSGIARCLGTGSGVPVNPRDAGSCERAAVIPCGSDRMVGVLALPQGPVRAAVVIAVGGPQYRAGSHRQFTLLARCLARDGIATLRFDYRGMGDSEGAMRTFESVGEDIARAVDYLDRETGLGQVVLWGLCDAASAALMYAPADDRVCGLVLLNPWVRTEAGEARTYLKHYYLRRLFAPDLWRRVFTGGFAWRKAARGLAGSVAAAAEGGRSAASGTLPERMADAFGRFRGRSLFILSGNDLTAREFQDAVRVSSRWQALMAAPGVALREVPEATHTFSSRPWRDAVATLTRDWVLADASCAARMQGSGMNAAPVCAGG